MARTDAALVAQAKAEPDRDLSDLPVLEVPAPLSSVDGTSFRRGDEIVRLRGIEGPARDAVCFDAEGYRWACGLQARAALHNAVAQRSFQCRPRRVIAPSEIAADCAVTGGDGPQGDLARLLVAQGWARPDLEAADALRLELEQARAARRGLWRGDWRLVPSAP